jgi:hypothetical protein
MIKMSIQATKIILFFYYAKYPQKRSVIQIVAESRSDTMWTYRVLDGTQVIVKKAL